MKPRTSSRKASSSALKRRSIGGAPLFGVSITRIGPIGPQNAVSTQSCNFALFATPERDHAPPARSATKGGAGMTELPGRALAQELAATSRDESRATAMEDVIAAARRPGLDEDAIHRLFSRLWVLERMFYYVYGGWGQGLEMNDFPPSVKYLFSKQIVDESTHENAVSRHAAAGRLCQDAERG